MDECIHCGGPYQVSVANARLCGECGLNVFSVGYDTDGVPLHVVVKGGGLVKYDDEAWINERARRPDGTRRLSCR